MSHTPGPWSVYPGMDGREICAVTHDPGLPVRQAIARVHVGDNWIGNGRLIAAAPLLLEALHHISLASQNSMSDRLELGRIARAAIATAKGGQ